MATFTFTDPNNKTHVVEGPPGATEAQAFQILQQRLGQPAPLSSVVDTPAISDLPSLDDPNFVPSEPATPEDLLRGRLETVSDFTRGTVIGDVPRGLGLGARAVAGAIPKAATGIADLASTILNVPISALDKLGQAGGDQPLDVRLPTGSTASLDALLSQIFPTPETMPERIVSTGGEMALTGGAASAALAPKVAQVARAPSLQSIPRNLADDIGEFFAKQPVKSSAMEVGGGVGAATGQELAQEADLSPGGQMLATLVGGITGGFTPQGVTNISRRAATGISNKLDAAFTGDVRAARALQEAAADPEAAARAALDAPEGVSAARAADEPKLRAMESKVLEDPVLAAKSQADLEAAEATTLKELSDQFGPKTNREEWQQEVIVRAAPDQTEIRIGQPDEMLDDAAKGFTNAYDDAKGYPLRTENVQVEGGNISLREAFGEATSSNSIIADKKWRKGISNFLDGLLDDVTKSGKPVGAADSGISEMDSAVLLEMRSKIRAQQRTRAKAGVNNPRAAAEAEMLTAANKSVTEAIESQLPAEAAAALRATDTRYKDFLTVQAAVVKSGDKGLTPEALKAALRTRSTTGDVARGRTGDLGRLAERGRDVAATLGKPQEAARIVRNMTPEQLQTAKADFSDAIIKKATPGDGLLKGKKYLEQLDANEATLTAAGFTKTELNQMRKVGRELKMIQSQSPGAVQALLEDDVGRVMRFLGAVAGSKSGSRLLKLTGGAGGAGPSLIVSQYGSKMMQQTLTKLSVDKADALIRDALSNKAVVAQLKGKDVSSNELFAALMVKPTDTIKRQSDAARVMQAWLARAAPETEEE